MGPSSDPNLTPHIVPPSPHGSVDTLSLSASMALALKLVITNLNINYDILFMIFGAW